MSAKSATSPLQFSNFLWISFGLHLLIFVIAALFSAGILGHRRPMIDLDTPVIWTDLSLGKTGTGGSTAVVQKPPVGEIKKPEPIATPQVIKPTKSPEKPASEVIKTAVKETAKKPPTPQPPKVQPPEEDPVQKAAEQRRLAMQSALANLKQDVATAPKSETTGGGDSKSGIGGTTQAQLFRMKIKRCIEDNIHVTDYDWFGKYREREVEYMLRIDQNGEIVEAKLRKSSGVTSMDQRVMEAIRVCEPFAAPTDDLRAFYVREGVSVRFSPKNLEH